MWLDLGGDIFNTDTITVVKKAGSKSECIVFVIGQSAVDSGFLVKMPFKQVARMLREVRLTEMSEYMDAAEGVEEAEAESEPGESDADADTDVEPIATLIQSSDQS